MTGALLLMLLAPAEPLLIDGVAAQVGRTVVTRSDVEAEARMVLVQRVGEAGLRQEVDDRFLSSVLDFVIVQELLAQRARREGIIVAEGDVDRGEAAFQARFSSEEAYSGFLRRHDVERDQIRAVVRRNGAAVELLRRRRARRPVEVEAVAIAGFLSANPDLAADAPPELRAQLARRRIIEVTLKERLSTFIDELKLLTVVRVVAYDAPPAEKGGPDEGAPGEGPEDEAAAGDARADKASSADLSADGGSAGGRSASEPVLSDPAPAERP